MATLIFDIETIGEDFEKMDATTKHALLHWIENDGILDDKSKQVKIEEIKSHLGLSPLSGEIVSISVLDYEKKKGATYYQSKNSAISSEKGIDYKVLTEAEMLKSFWEGVRAYQNFVTFNGGSFDVPYLMMRSAIHKIRPTKNLMSNRYLKNQDFGAKHIDLLEQMTFYGACGRKGMSLHMFCRAFGIQSSKTGKDGSHVAELYREGKFEEIARYNSEDVFATAELYSRWNEFLNFDNLK
jgi:3'-5' exonuclease